MASSKSTDNPCFSSILDDGIAIQRPLLGVDINSPLLEAARLFVKHQVNAIALFEQNEKQEQHFVTTMSHHHLLKFVAANVR